MKSFLKSFLFFLCWVALAFYIQIKKDDFIIPTVKIDTISNALTIPASLKTDSTNLLEKDTINKAIDTILAVKNTTVKNINTQPVAFPFNKKFITNADHTRVILLKKFNYIKDSIFNYLTNNTTEEITINAYYLPSEKLANSNNFGMERAINLKSKLVQYGVNPLKINCKAIEKEYSYDNEGYYADGIFITHNTIAEEKFKIVNEDTANKNFFVTDVKPKSIPQALKFYAAEARDYLKENPSKNLLVIGETITDNNKEEALVRAKTVAKLLTNQGIDSTRIIYEYKEIKQPQKTNIAFKILTIKEQK
ncbi:OmpA family protein [Tenacibaculum sp. SG-28]|uniref:OmpA family protein n=1 Tax=Tenacibaculum sp. SG-28 TaxID=754426 RepID=UPI000CF426B7|nr:OmpA family protein [Tenacibaculum sp. SG-28]PQJ23160.1 hypothetical protein BSU00_02700 [Tenacibaculum sp. SG-28]